MGITPFVRQVSVAVSTFMAAFSIGGAVTYPTLLMEHFRSNETSIHLDIGTKSWIGSIYGLAGIPSICMPMISQSIGRKYGYTITCIFLIIGWILAYTSRNITELLISESFHGFGTNSLLPVSFQGITEMLSPKYRIRSMLTFCVMQTLGMASCGIMGRFLHFKTVSIIMLIPILVAAMSISLWPESPYWLAYKGKFTKCETVFIKLRGEDDASKKELNELITAHKENLSHNGGGAISLARWWRNISRRDFYMPTFHMFILLNMAHWSGADVILIYFTEMVAKSTKNENTAFYASIVMYFIIVVEIFITNLLSAWFKNKTVLFSSAFGALLFLFFGCIITVLQNSGVLAANSSLMMYCLLGFMSVSRNATAFTICSELMPVKHRSIGGALQIIFNCVLSTSALKLSPYLFLYIGTLGTFLVYIGSTLSCVLYAWRYIPETKGKSLQEIEDFYVFGYFVQRECDDTVTPLNKKP